MTGNKDGLGFHLPRQMAFFAALVLALVILGSVVVYQQAQIAALNNDVSSYSHATFRSAPALRTFSLPLPGIAASSVYDPSDEYTYVSYGNGSTGGVSVISGTTSVANITLDSGSALLLYNPSNQYVYTASLSNDRVSVISGTKVLAVQPVSFTPGDPALFLCYDPADRLVYETGAASGIIQVVNGTEALPEILLAHSPSPASMTLRTAICIFQTLMRMTSSSSMGHPSRPR
jgi:DNA-binding beta-propeller fold protein YncE